MSKDVVAEETVESESDTEMDVHDVALQLIDELTSTLGELRGELADADGRLVED